MGWHSFKHNGSRWNISPAGICPVFACQRLHPWLCSQLPAGLLSRRLAHRSGPDAGLPRQDLDEGSPEAPGCFKERGLFLITKGQHVGTSLLAAATDSSVSVCALAGVIVTSESPRPPSHGFCRNHWARSVSVRFTPTQQATA